MTLSLSLHVGNLSPMLVSCCIVVFELALYEMINELLKALVAMGVNMTDG